MSWSEAKLEVSHRVARSLDFLELAKQQIQKDVKRDTGISIEKPDPTGHGGTTTTGNVAKSLLNTTHRTLLTKHIDSIDLKEKIDKIILNMAVILCIKNSNRKVNIDVYREFCKNTALMVKEVPWIKFTPSAHQVLAHSAELIENNNELGLLNYTEAGLEANNKLLRQYRINYSRKTNQHDNLSDCLNRLWDKGDPEVLKIGDRLYCTHCKEHSHTVKSCQKRKKDMQTCSTDIDYLLSMMTVKLNWNSPYI